METNNRNLSFGKKCVAFLIGIAMLLSAVITPMAAGYVGDLNGDDTVSAPDLVTLKTVLLLGDADMDYDVNGDGTVNILDLVRLKKMLAQAKTEVTAPVKSVDGKVSESLTLAAGGVSAFVPEGVLLEDGVSSLTLTVVPLTSSGIPAGEDEKVSSYDVHISGISKDNTVPVIIDLGAVMPKYLNMGNYKIYHVENGENKLMILVDSREELVAHNQFTYEPETGKVTVAMATFSEVAMVSNETNAWNGNFDYKFNGTGTEVDPYIISTADQLAGLGAIVGGMNQQNQNSYSGKFFKLISDINLGDAEEKNDADKIFYPIGYYNSEGTYEKTGTAITSGFKTFEGTFDGNGHTISNFYQNTWEMKGDHDWYTPEDQYYRDGMGLFGKIYGGTVKNLTVDNFKSDGEIATTGVIAAYADFGATFENIAITNCNPRVYNIGNGGIVGCVGWYTESETDKVITFKNITIDNTNKISALWGSWDVACGGIVGQYYPTSGQSSANNPKNAGIEFKNCHVAAQIDVYNDVCANYQYYAYRYAGMMIGSIRENETINGYVYPKMDGITAKGCTVHYDTWNDYFYCELKANSIASYTHDYQFSRLDMVDSVDVANKTITVDGKTTVIPATGKHNYVVVNGEFATENATCYHFVDGEVWNHTDAGTETVNGVEIAVENHAHIYLPFAQLFTGYGWGVTSKGVSDYEGIETMDIKESDKKESVVKFATKFTGDFLYRVGNANAVSLSSLFKAKDGADINNSSVWVSIEKQDENMNVYGTYTQNTSDWTQGSIKFEGTGVVKVTIQDYQYCTPTVLYIEVVDAKNVTSATNATENNVVLLNDIGSGFTVSGRYTVYGNGFTLNYTGNGQYLNNGLKQGIVTVSENGTLDNLRIKATIYPSAYMYYGKTSLGDYVQGGPSSVEGDKTRYHYQLSAVVAKGNATISNCYIYGARTNIFVDTGDVTIKDTVLECGVVSNIQIQSNASHTIILEDVTTIQYQVNPTIVDTSKVMLGAGVLVGPETTENPKIVLKGDFKQYNWVTKDDTDVVSDKITKMIINGAVNATDFNHTINGNTSSNLGIIYMNTESATIENNTGLPYEDGTVTLEYSGNKINGKAYSLQNATPEQIYSDYENADKTTVNGLYKPQFKYSENLGGQYAPDNGGDEFCYREGDTIYVMFPSGDGKELDLAGFVNIAKYSGQDLSLAITCKDENGNAVTVTNNKVTLSDAGKYTVTYKVTDTLFYDKDGNVIENKSIDYSWDVTISVSLKDTAIPDARFEFDTTKQKMGYYKPTIGDVKQYLPFLAGLKIYDYNGKTEYLRFDGSNDFNKIASITITGYESNKALVEIKLTDGGVINTRFLARANSGGGSTYTGKIKTNNNTIYFVTDSGTSNKDTTTTAAYWYVDYYKFTGNNGVAIQSGQQTFNSTGSSASTPSGSFSTSINYTVTYDANQGNCGQTTGYATSASTAVTLPTPTRSGYIFAGWYTAASGGTRVGVAGENYVPSANITLYAQWGKPCTVTYDANGGSCGTTSEKYTGEALTLPTPTRDGYWFIGWYDAAEGGNKIGDADAKYNPAGETTLYAHWQEKVEYTVTYNANGGSCSISSATYQGTTLTLPIPTRTGYEFSGWYDAAEGGNKIGDANTSYIPSANTTLYAQWTIKSYTITVTTSNATVKVNGTQVNNNGTVKIQFDTLVTVAVTYSQSNSKSTTIKGTDGVTYTSPFNMPAQNVTINATSSGSCVTPDTLITLADGSQVRVDSLTGDEMLLVWNHETGKLDTAPVAYIVNHDGVATKQEVIRLVFSDGSELKIIGEHVFFDATLNKYVALDTNAADFIGHSFLSLNSSDNGLKKVELVSVEKSIVETSAYEVVSYKHLTCFTNSILSTSAYLDPLLNIFDIDTNTFAYINESVQKEIETYGLYTYADFDGLISEEAFELYNAQYLKIAVGKGYITWNDILSLIDIYFNVEVNPL